MTAASSKDWSPTSTRVSLTSTLYCRELDSLAEKFALASSKADREKILFAAESWAGEKGEGAEVYIKIMKGALDTGKQGLVNEKERIAKMLGEKSSDKVKEKLKRKQNVLGSFRYRRDEL